MTEFSISSSAQKELLSIARKAVARQLETGRQWFPEIEDGELREPAAVFVTLMLHGQLRGCIGTTVPQHPLGEAVAHMAVSAAFEDYRFPPVNDGELKDIRIEISVLSPMRKVAGADEIRQDEHGVVVRSGGRSGLFLPQVWEHFDSKEGFLNELCWQKCGIDPNAWKEPGTELSVFTVFAFEEE